MTQNIEGQQRSFSSVHWGIQNAHGWIKYHLPTADMPPRVTIITFPKPYLGSHRIAWDCFPSGGGHGFDCVSGGSYVSTVGNSKHPLQDVSLPSDILGASGELNGILETDESERNCLSCWISRWRRHSQWHEPASFWVDTQPFSSYGRAYIVRNGIKHHQLTWYTVWVRRYDFRPLIIVINEISFHIMPFRLSHI